MSKYVFSSLHTALYLPGNMARSYIPMHGMVVAEYVDYDLTLRLIIYSVMGNRKDSFFAWTWYRLNEESGLLEISNVEEAIFDKGLPATEQVLPSKKRMGALIYKMIGGV